MSTHETSSDPQSNEQQKGGDSGEGLVQELIGRLGRLEQELGATRKSLDELTIAQMAERRLIAAGALEPEKHAVQIARELAGGTGVDLKAIDARVAQLRKASPGAFKAPARAGVMGPGAQAIPRMSRASEPTKAIGGDRRSLAEYLRQRRQRKGQ